MASTTAATSSAAAPPVAGGLDFASLQQTARENVKTHSSVFNHMNDQQMVEAVSNKDTTPGEYLTQLVLESIPKDQRIKTAEGRRGEQGMGAFHTLTGLLQDRGPELGAIAVQGLASLFDNSAPQAPWGGPGTSIGPQNTMAMMLALLWPDLAAPLADPALLTAADALDPTAVPQVVAAAAAMLPADNTTHLARQLLPWTTRTVAWAATLDPSSPWDAGTMGTVSTLANVATMLTGPDADAFVADPSLLPSLLNLAQRDAAATAAAIAAAIGAANDAAGGALTADMVDFVDMANALSSQTQAALSGAARVTGRRRLADAGITSGGGAAGTAAPASGAAGAASTAGGATPPGTPATGAPAPGSTSAAGAGGAFDAAGFAAAGGTPAADTAPIAPPASTGDAAAAAWDYYKSRGAAVGGAAGTPTSTPTAAGGAAATGAPPSSAPAGAPQAADPAATPGRR